MKLILKLEEAGLLIFSLYIALNINPNFLLLIIVFFLPDLGMLGYLINSKFGALTYNLLHHKGIASILIVVGYLILNPIVIYIGAIILAHSSFDRILGYGLKYSDSFNNTNLGKIGKSSSN